MENKIQEKEKIKTESTVYDFDRPHRLASYLMK